MTDTTPSPPLHPVPSARLRRTSSLSLMDGGSSLLGSFAHKFQSKRGALPGPPGPSLPTPHHHSHRRKPMVIYYSSTAAAGPSPSPSAREDRASGQSTDGDEDGDGPVRSSRRLSRAHTLDELDGFDVESAMANYASSFGPRPPSAFSSASAGTVPSPAAPPAPSRRSSTLRRMSMRFSHGRAPASPSVPTAGSAAGRADAKARKYDVDWRDDRAAACCQLCFSVFTTLSRRRHHCRLCGELVCGSCSPDQVALVDKFAGPKRACNACFALLETLAAAKDPRILRVDGTHHRYPVPSAATSASAPAPADDGTVLTADAPSTPSGSALLLIAPPTPHYRDRMAEVRRVMAAGQKSKRRGSNGRAGVMCVVPSAWVRQWLAFTEGSTKDEAGAPSSSSSSASGGPDYEPRPATRSTGSSRSPSPTSVVPAPGPINNWQLLEFSQGRLAQRPDATRDDGPTGSADGSADPQQPLGFQLITTEVYEVFQRLYGGGPTVRVDMGTSKQWMVDIGPVLAALPAAKVSPAVERALLQRHAVRSDSDAAPPSAVGSPCVVTPTADHKASGSPTASSSDTTVLSDDDGSNNSVVLSAAALEPALAVTTVTTEAGVASPGGGDASVASSAAMRSPSAATATAASAFALAMKQARLNAQRAIDERARVA